MNWQGYWILAVIGIVSLAIAVVILIVTGQCMGTAVSAGFLIASVAFVSRDRWVPSTRSLPVLFDALFVAAVVINAGGWVWHLYDTVPGYDEVAHAFTSFAVTLGYSHLLHHSTQVTFRSRGPLFVLVVATFKPDSVQASDGRLKVMMGIVSMIPYDERFRAAVADMATRGGARRGARRGDPTESIVRLAALLLTSLVRPGSVDIPGVHGNSRCADPAVGGSRSGERRCSHVTAAGGVTRGTRATGEA